MEKINFYITTYKKFTLVEFKLEGALSPKDLKEIAPPLIEEGAIPATKGVILSGRGPIWLYGFLSHLYHPARWVAFYDPRVGGGVVVQSHNKNIKEGDIVNI